MDGWVLQLIERAPDAIVVIDHSGAITLVNRQTEQMFGYERAELIGKTIELLVPERHRGQHVGHRTSFAQAAATRPMGAGRELTARRKDGSEVAVEISLGPIETSAGMMTASTIRDVSERRAAQLVLKRLATIVDASAEAIVGMTREGFVTSWNRGAEAVYGYTPDEMLGEPLSRLVPPELESNERVIVARIGLDERVADRETVHVRKDGERITVAMTLSPLRDRGSIVGGSMIARDITERRRIEEEARRTASHLRNAVESIADAFVLHDDHDQIVIVNSTARELLGRDLDGALVGRSFSKAVDAVIAAGTFDVVGETREAVRERWRAYHGDPAGVLDLRTAGGALRIAARRTTEGGTVVLMSDITDDIAREDELRRARAGAEAASAAKSEFLASMSHELRTPLNAILGFAELLRRDRKTPLTERQQDRLAHVTRGGEHLLRLIDEVLDLAGIEAGRVTISPEPVVVDEVIAHVVAALGPMAQGAGITLVPPQSSIVREVRADRTRLIQILMNFGSNAIKYSRSYGHAEFLIAADACTVRLSVRDDGMGIPEKYHDRLFEPFQRAGQEAGSIEGTGIGLAISKRLAELMAGRVGFTSTVGVGSEFWVDVPRYDAPRTGLQATLEAAQVRPADFVAGPPRLIVYVEDNPSNIAFMRELISDLPGLELMTAHSAEIGLDLIRTHLPAAVIMDIKLPGMSGVEATRRLGDWPETRQIPVVALSAAAMPRDTARAAESGFYRYLTKPVKVDELLKVLADLLGRT